MADCNHARAAREYLDEVLATQRRHGLHPKVAKQRYERTVAETARVFERLAEAADEAALHEARPRRRP